MDPSSFFAELFPTLDPLRETLAGLLPKLAAAIVVLALGWLLAQTLRALTRRIVRRLAGRVPAGPAQSAFRQAVVGGGAERIVAGGVYWLVFLATLMVATEVVGLPVLTTWLSAVTNYLPKVVLALTIVFAGVVGGRLVRDATEGAAYRLAPHQARKLARLAQLCTVGAAVLVAAAQVGLDVSLLTAVFLIVLATLLGGAALAFALGARSVIANVVAMHYVQKSYAVGQHIRMGEDQGRIVRTTATMVFLEHADGEIGIPGQLFADQRCVRIGQGQSDGS